MILLILVIISKVTNAFIVVISSPTSCFIIIKDTFSSPTTGNLIYMGSFWDVGLYVFHNGYYKSPVS